MSMRNILMAATAIKGEAVGKKNIQGRKINEFSTAAKKKYPSTCLHHDEMKEKEKETLDYFRNGHDSIFSCHISSVICLESVFNAVINKIY